MHIHTQQILFDWFSSDVYRHSENSNFVDEFELQTETQLSTNV